MNAVLPFVLPLGNMIIHYHKMTITWIFNIVDISTKAAHIIVKQYLLVYEYKLDTANQIAWYKWNLICISAEFVCVRCDDDISEPERLTAVGSGQSGPSFRVPRLLHWSPQPVALSRQLPCSHGEPVDLYSSGTCVYITDIRRNLFKFSVQF